MANSSLKHRIKQRVKLLVERENKLEKDRRREALEAQKRQVQEARDRVRKHLNDIASAAISIDKQLPDLVTSSKTQSVNLRFHQSRSYGNGNIVDAIQIWNNLPVNADYHTHSFKKLHDWESVESHTHAAETFVSVWNNMHPDLLASLANPTTVQIDISGCMKRR